MCCLYVCFYSPREKLGNIEVKGIHLKSGRLGWNCSSTTYCDPRQVLNMADAASSLACMHLALTIPMRAGSSLLQEPARSLRVFSGYRSKYYFPQGRTKVPRNSILPRAVFSQWDQELEDKSLSSLVLVWDNSEVSSTVSQSSPGGLGPSCSQLSPSYYCFHSPPPLLSDDFCNHHFSFTTCIQISAQGLILEETQPKSLNFWV